MTKADDEPEMCVYEWTAGKPLPPNARDCSDEFLPEAERVTDDERAELKNSTSRPDWSRTGGGGRGVGVITGLERALWRTAQAI